MRQRDSNIAMDGDLEAPPKLQFGFAAFTALLLLLFAAAPTLLYGAWTFTEDLRNPLWGEDELAPFAFAMTTIAGILGAALALAALALCWAYGLSGVIRRCAQLCVVIGVLMILASPFAAGTALA